MKKGVVSLLFGSLLALGCGPASTPPLPYNVPPAAATAGTAAPGGTLPPPPPAKTGP